LGITVIWMVISIYLVLDFEIKIVLIMVANWYHLEDTEHGKIDTG
jgi:hypothetical protein